MKQNHGKRVLACGLAAALLLGAGSALAAQQVQGTQDSSVKVTVDGRPVTMRDVNGNPVEPIIVNGTTYLPVRAVSEANGMDVNWKEGSREVQLTTGNVQSLEVRSVTANCTSEPYGKAIHSFTYAVNSTDSVRNMKASDFKMVHCVYDGMETHDLFDAAAKSISFTNDSVTVEVESFYPDMSFSREGYWKLICTNEAFNVDAGSTLIYSDPVAEAFDEFTHTYGDAVLDCYLYTPEGSGKNMPIVIFNSGGTGISVTGDVYGANFAVSFAKEEAQHKMPCYVLYPQRMEGSVDNLCAGVKEVVDDLVAEGKVDASRIYMTGESAGSAFTMNFVSRYPGWNTAIAIFDGAGGEYRNAANLEEAVKIDASSPFSDAETKQLAESGTKVMLVQSLGDTTSPPIGYAATYQKLINYGMKPGVDVVWHYYTAEMFNQLLNDRTVWEPVADAGYVTDPVTGIQTYYYPEGKLHNSSYPAANDNYIKMWLMGQDKDPYSVEFTENYSALYTSAHTDYSMIPERYTKMAVLENVPAVPAGQKSTVTVYTDDAGEFYYLAFTPVQGR